MTRRGGIASLGLIVFRLPRKALMRSWIPLAPHQKKGDQLSSDEQRGGIRIVLFFIFLNIFV